MEKYEDWAVLFFDDDQAFTFKLGERVQKGETMGHCFGRLVQAPFDAIVDHISVDVHNQSLLVTLIQQMEA